MADFNNLLPGDEVDWVRKLRQHDELVRAKVWGKAGGKVAIRFEDNGVLLTKNVDASSLRLIFGGKKRLEREAAKLVRPLRAFPTEVATPPMELLNV